MIAESAAILCVGLLLVIVFVRSKHPGYLVGTLPILIIPSTHLMITFVLYLSRSRFFGIRPAIVTAFADVLGLVLTCACVVGFAMKIESKKNRKLYLITLLGYSLVLGWVYIFRSIQPLLG